MMGKCYSTIEIKAPIKKARDTINGFYDVSWAPGVVTSVTQAGDKNGDEE